MATKQKTCLITGCSEGGVGAALAQAFVDQGYHVYATARTTSKIPKSLQEAADVTILSLDVASTSSIAAAVQAVHEHTGGSLDVLINNAGAGMVMPTLDSSIAESKKLFDLNFFSVIETIQAFIPMLVKAKGCIVNNASVGGFRPLVFNGMYGASKAALIQVGEALRLEVAPLGIRVVTLVTGGVQTRFIGNLEPVVLANESYYHSIKDVIEEQPEKIPFAVTPEAFAIDVFRKVEGGAVGKIWIGGGAALARVAYWLLPEWAIDRMMLSMKRPFNEQLRESV